jgi:hypothetical protein
MKMYGGNGGTAQTVLISAVIICERVDPRLGSSVPGHPLDTGLGGPHGSQRSGPSAAAMPTELS